MAPPSNRYQPRWALVLAQVALSAAALRGAAAAAPDAKPPNSNERQQRAEREFSAALTSIEAWCDELATAEREQPDQLTWTLRRAQCLRMRSGTEPAEALLAAATKRVGTATMATAQAALDAEIGAATPPEDPRRHAIERHWKSACTHFQASLEAEPSPATQLAVATCHLRAGKLRAANVMASAARSKLEPQAASDGYRAQQLALALWLGREIERLQPRLLLRTHSAFHGTVRVAADELTGTASLLVDPGTHPVTAQLRGATQTTSLTVTPGQRLELRIDEPSRILDTPRKILVWGGLGLGATSAATAGIMYWRAQNKWSALERAGCKRSSSLGGELDCPAAVSIDQADAYNRTIDVFQVGGAAALLLLTTSAVTYFTVPRTEALHIVPLAAGQRTGVAVAGSF